MAERTDGTGTHINVRRTGAREARIKEIARRRKIIRRAFDTVRHDAAEAEIMTTLLGALTGKTDITEKMIEAARQIISDKEAK